MNDDLKSFIHCKHCGESHEIMLLSQINENIISSRAIYEMVYFIRDLLVSKNAHLLVGYKNKAFFNEYFINIKKNENMLVLNSIKNFILGNKSNLFDEIKKPSIPNELNGIYSGFGIYSSNYKDWFYKVLDSDINPFTGDSSLIDTIFYKKTVEVIDGDITLNWEKTWEYISDNIGLRNANDIWDTKRIKYEASRAFYYQFALEHELKREYDEVISTLPENLSNEERRFFFHFEMHKKSDDYKEHTEFFRDFNEVCKSVVFNDNMEWDNKYFNLNEWDQTYWGHVLVLDSLTKQHPARKKHKVIFS